MLFIRHKTINRTDTQSTVHVFPTGRNVQPVVRTWRVFYFFYLNRRENEAKSLSKHCLMDTHRHGHRCIIKYGYKLYDYGHKVVVCHAPLPAHCSSHRALSCRVVPGGMKRSCSTGPRRSLSGIISGWFLYCSPGVSAPSLASGCRLRVSVL